MASFVFVTASLISSRAEAADLLRLSWDAPAGCPSGESVRAAAVRNAPAAAIPLEADAVVAHRDRWTVTLRTRRADTSGERVLEAASCTALADATAVILALALVPPGEAITAPLAPASSSDASSAPAAAPVSAPASAPPPASAPAPAPAPAPASADRPSSPPSSSSSSRPSGRPAIAVGAFAGTDATTLPGVALGGGGSLAWTPGSSLRIETTVSIFAGQSQTLDASTAGARFSMTSLGAGACYTLLHGAFELAPCGGGSMHWVSAEGFGATANYDASARWAAVDAGLLARAPLTSWLALRARADGLVPLGRPSFEVENEGVVHKPPPLGIRAALGVELNFL